jgi:putative copper resistance protein D
VWSIDPQAKLRARVIAIALASAVACSIGWLAIEAVKMSGEALRAGLLVVVLHATQFGHVWMLRACVVVVVAIVAWVASNAATARARRFAVVATALLAGAHVALLALMGHASAVGGLRGLGEVVVDAIHLVAAGAWLGTLPALSATLASTRSRDAIARVTRRYSQVGCVAATAVLASGIVNAGLRNVGPVELVTTDYGRLLLVKLAFVAAMLALAATNRFVLTPRLRSGDALAALRRNAWLEIVLGILVVGVVGALGITAPPVMDMAHSMH